MSEVSLPRIGTREHYNTRVMPLNARKQELLKKLEEKVWREVAILLPENERPTEAEFSDPKLLINHDAWSDLYWSRDKNSITERVRTNVLSRQMAQLQGSVDKILVYKFLLELRDSIYYTDGHLDRSGWDEGTREMGKEWAHNFVSRWIEAFENRQYLPAEDNSDDSGREENWTLRKQYELLMKIENLPNESKNSFIKAICLELPSYPGAELHWEDIQSIYNHRTNSNMK